VNETVAATDPHDSMGVGSGALTHVNEEELFSSQPEVAPPRDANCVESSSCMAGVDPYDYNKPPTLSDDTLRSIKPLSPNPSYCCVKHCENNANGLIWWGNQICAVHNGLHGSKKCLCPPPFQLFSFPFRRYPEYKERMKMWVAILNPNDWRGKTWTPHHRARVCSRHFIDGHPNNMHPFPELNLNLEDTSTDMQKQLLPKKRGKVVIMKATDIKVRPRFRLKENMMTVFGSQDSDMKTEKEGCGFSRQVEQNLVGEMSSSPTTGVCGQIKEELPDEFEADMSKCDNIKKEPTDCVDMDHFDQNEKVSMEIDSYDHVETGSVDPTENDPPTGNHIEVEQNVDAGISVGTSSNTSSDMEDSAHSGEEEEEEDPFEPLHGASVKMEQEETKESQCEVSRGQDPSHSHICVAVSKMCKVSKSVHKRRLVLFETVQLWGFN
jgi:hypothetical protein